MNTVSLKILPNAIAVTLPAGATADQLRITDDPDQSIGDNLENLRVQLVGIDFDAIIIENPLSYPFSDTIVGFHGGRIDIGLALTNMFNVPVVAQPTVKRVGLAEALNAKREQASWHLDYYGQYQGKRNRGQEAMLTIGNGFYGLRGAYVEAQADADNYPGLYVAGVYNQTTTTINGRDVTNEDLVNLPNVQALTVSIDQGNPIRIRHRDIHDIYRSLDLRTGRLTTTLMLALATGHQLMIQTQKVAGMNHWHQLGLRYAITPLNFAGTIQVSATIDGDVVNGNVDRYAQFDQHHVAVTGMASAGERALLTGQTKTSHIEFALGSKLTTGVKAAPVKTTTGAKAIRQSLTLDVQPGETYTVDKTVAIFTSRETSGALDTAVWEELAGADFDHIAADSATYYRHLWQTSDITIDGDLISQKLLRVNAFHLAVAGGALASGQLDASVGARGLHGEAYRGHVFWDELFVMPAYIDQSPAIAKQMLLYRYRRLPAAREAAKAAGNAGAMFPWQSASRGDEQAQSLHLNPLTNQWDPDYSRRQRHVSLAIAYNVWLYWHTTGDDAFMRDHGLEMLLSIGKFWLSKAELDPQTKQYHISGVMGPDEFHEGYPNAKTAGLTDNTYTNLLVAWLLGILQQLQAPFAKTWGQAAQASDWQAADTKLAAALQQHLAIPVNRDGILGQFAGYFKLPTLDFDAYRKQYGDISRLDRILKAAGKTPDAYQVAKQADTLMAWYLLPKASMQHLLKGLGVKLPSDYFAQNLQFYLDRTTHGSTLSRIVYAALTLMAGRSDQSWQFYHQALFSDYWDIQGGTTAEGIHLGVMGATLNVATQVYGGADLRGPQPTITPHLPDHWTKLSFSLRWHGTVLRVTETAATITVQADHDLTLQVLGRPLSLTANQAQTVTMGKDEEHESL